MKLELAPQTAKYIREEITKFEMELRRQMDIADLDHCEITFQFNRTTVNVITTKVNCSFEKHLVGGFEV